MEEEVFGVNIGHNEPVVLPLIEELESPRDLILQVVRVTLIKHVLLHLLLCGRCCVLGQHVLVLLEYLSIQCNLIDCTLRIWIGGWGKSGHFAGGDEGFACDV
jgi:hypothetical protein